jgi:hypothetical protein
MSKIIVHASSLHILYKIYTLLKMMNLGTYPEKLAATFVYYNL